MSHRFDVSGTGVLKRFDPGHPCRFSKNPGVCITLKSKFISKFREEFARKSSPLDSRKGVRMFGNTLSGKPGMKSSRQLQFLENAGHG